MIHTSLSRILMDYIWALMCRRVISLSSQLLSLQSWEIIFAVFCQFNDCNVSVFFFLQDWRLIELNYWIIIEGAAWRSTKLRTSFIAFFYCWIRADKVNDKELVVFIQLEMQRGKELRRPLSATWYDMRFWKGPK